MTVPEKTCTFACGSAGVVGAITQEGKNKDTFQRVQCLWLRAALDLSSHDVALAIGWKASSVRHLQAQYLKEGEPVLAASKRGGRYWANMTVDEERLFLSSFRKKSARGEILETPSKYFCMLSPKTMLGLV